MSTDKKKIAAQCWQTGSAAMGKESWDYAIEMFGRAAALVPDNLMYRQALRGVEYKKYNNNKTGAKMSSMKLMPIRGKIKKARMKSDWDSVNRDAEEGLVVNPWDPQLNADVGEACRNLGFGEIAVWAFKLAVEGEPNNKDFNQQLADALEFQGEFATAIKVWERVLKLDPMDGDARSKVTQLQANTVLDKGSYDKTDQPAGPGGAKPAEVDGPGMSEEADLKRQIRKEPENKDNYLRLGDYYKREERLEDARKCFKKALEVSGGDPNIREQVEDLDLDLLRHNATLAKEAANNDADNKELRQKSIEVAKELLHREIEIYAARVERYPADLRIKFDLANRYMRAQEFGKAIPLLQQTVKDKRLSGEALIALAECFMYEKKQSLAKRQLEKAIPELDQIEQPELFKKAHYWAGRLCEEAEDMTGAEDHYNEVLAVDYEYKDALQRLEGLQSN